MINQIQRKKPFVFRPSQETIKYFKDASPEAKLNWLEEANRFVNDFVSPLKLERWKKISGR
ncbi:MAG: hypothetical protein M0R70_08230 [Nitrospirae bacterium]|nr:hypothetical protein [Nitrospirota bacterium]